MEKSHPKSWLGISAINEMLRIKGMVVLAVSHHPYRLLLTRNRAGSLGVLWKDATLSAPSGVVKSKSMVPPFQITSVDFTSPFWQSVEYHGKV